jgi:hypothetical protein
MFLDLPPPPPQEFHTIRLTQPPWFFKPNTRSNWPAVEIHQFLVT